ncbi:MAG: hypothetical protein ACE5EY_06140 [Anaerolineae bacterium]
MSDVNMFFFRGRKASVLIAVLLSLYLNGYAWFFVPHTDFGFYWRPDHQLRINYVTEESLAAPYLQVGDEVLAIDGRSAHRRAAVFTGPVKSSYQYTIWRDGEPHVFDVPFSASPTEIGRLNRLPTGLLTLALLVVGAGILYFATKSHRVAMRVGYIFVIQAVAILGLQMELLNVPGAWISRLVWYVLGVATTYLGFVPHSEPLSPRVRQAFK